MGLTHVQRKVLEKALKGHNLLILGKSGTGKSFLIKEIEKGLAQQSINVKVTASTGIASLNIGGQTIHSWSGIADGRYSNDEIVDKVNKNEHFQGYKNNILKTGCLIIDEISMLSSKLFDQIEYLCRKILNSNIIFGGMQVIAVGDFIQLPPVPDALKNDPGDFSFKSEIFKQLFQHKFILNEVLRQHQPDLIKAINEVSMGELSNDTFDLLTRLKRPLPPGPPPIRLNSRNFDCEIHNAMMLMDMPGEKQVYSSIDEGDVSKLEKIPVSRQLHLKIGCPVMLLKNLSGKLVNGLRGTVTALSNNCVSVNFIGVNKENLTANLKPETFLIYSCNEGKVVASRKQIPLCLAFSITIHKSQGLTLERVEVDASNVFAPGQLGVAIGRVTEKKGLRVIGFNKSCILKHESSLYSFYENCDEGEFDDSGKLSCCKVEIKVENETSEQLSIETHHEEQLSDFSDGELEEIEFLFSNDSDVSDLHVTDTENISDHFIDIDDISEIFAKSEEGTPQGMPVANQTLHAKFKEIFANQPNKLQVFVSKLYAKINDMFETCCGDVSEKSTEPKIWTKYHTELYQYSVSSEYVGLVRSLVLSEPSRSDFQLCSEIFDKVASTVLQRHTNVTTNTSNCPSQQEMSDSCKGKLRYIFGRCIAKSRYHNMKRSMTNLYNKSKVNTLTKQFLKVKMLDSLTKNYSELESTSKYKETLYQTQRKQNLTQGLTNIDDKVFEFILKVENKRCAIQTDTSFSVYGSDVLSYTHNKLLKDTNLFENW